MVPISSSLTDVPLALVDQSTTKRENFLEKFAWGPLWEALVTSLWGHAHRAPEWTAQSHPPSYCQNYLQITRYI